MQSRWESAQSVEKDHGTHTSMDKRKRAVAKLANVDLELSDFDSARVLAVGGGTGAIHSLSNAECAVSVDPITLDKNDVLSESEAHLTTAVGEYLPFDSNCFDYVLCINVLDHTLNPRNVLREIKRVLTDDGTLLLKLNVYELPEFVLQRLSIVDRPHLHHYSSNSLQTLLTELGFETAITKYTKKSFRDYDETSIKKIVATLLLQWAQIWLTATPDSQLD